MGYKSDGAVYLSDEALFVLPQELRKDLKENWDKESDNIYYFYDVKWYTGVHGYEIITKWEQFFDKLKEKDISYDFIRLGEDDQDNVVLTYEKFYVNRTIGIY